MGQVKDPNLKLAFLLKTFDLNLLQQDIFESILNLLENLVYPGVLYGLVSKGALVF